MSINADFLKDQVNKVQNQVDNIQVYNSQNRLGSDYRKTKSSIFVSDEGETPRFWKRSGAMGIASDYYSKQ